MAMHSQNLLVNKPIHNPAEQGPNLFHRHGSFVSKYYLCPQQVARHAAIREFLLQYYKHRVLRSNNSSRVFRCGSRSYNKPAAFLILRVIDVPQSSTSIVSMEYSPFPFDTHFVPFAFLSPAFRLIRVTEFETIKAE